MLTGAHTKSSKQAGMTLIELMVGLSVGAIVIVGLMLGWAVFVKQNDYLLRSARLNQEVRALFQVVTQDVRRAIGGTGLSAIELVCLDGSSGCDPDEVQPSVGDCMVFRMNVDQSDVVDSIVTVPTGYRVRNGALEMWWPGERDVTLADYGYVSSSGKCAADDAVHWVPLVDSATSGLQNFRMQAAVTNARCLDLYVSASETAGRCGSAPKEKVEMLLVDIVLSGSAQVGNGAARQFLFSDSVKVRNDTVFQ